MAHQLLANHDKHPIQLALIGRQPLSSLDPLLYTSDTYCQADLAQPEAIQRISEWLDEQKIERLDYLIHNAAQGYVGSLLDQSNGSINSLLQVNLQSPLALTQRLMPKLNVGKVVFISSVVTAIPSPDYAVYAATKAALDGFTRNLRTELNAPGARYETKVQLIRPGAIRTDMHEKSGADLEALKWEKFPSVESVATQVLQTIESERPTSVIGSVNKMVDRTGRYLGGPLDWAIRGMRSREYPSDTSKAPISAQDTANQRRHCVITGAADGIGKALTQLYLASGWQVTGIDFEQEQAAQTQAELDPSGDRLSFIFGDLGSSTDLERIESELDERPIIELLIHNAGINAVGYFTKLDWSRQQKVLDVNLRAPLMLTAGLLRRKHLSPRGNIVFISSLSYFVGYPGAAVYGASKDGIASFARSLRVALAPQRINVLTVFPGPTRTAHARRYSPDNSREEKRMAPEELAKRIVNAVEKGQKQLVPGITNQASASIGKFLPGLMDYVMRKVILEKLEN